MEILDWADTFAKVVLWIFAIGTGVLAFILLGVFGLKAGVDRLDGWINRKHKKLRRK